MSDPLAEILNKARLQLGRTRFGGDGALALQLIADLCNEIQRLHNPPKPKQHYKCSFCGKSNDVVEKLIAGPSTFICNECVGLCNEIIDAEPLATASKEGGE